MTYLAMFNKGRYTQTQSSSAKNLSSVGQLLVNPRLHNASQLDCGCKVAIVNTKWPYHVDQRGAWSTLPEEVMGGPERRNRDPNEVEQSRPILVV